MRENLRVRLRLCSGIHVIDVFRETFALTAPIGPALFRMREFLSREFRNDPQIQREVFDPLEEIWHARLKLVRQG
jgi:hypothetical protein